MVWRSENLLVLGLFSEFWWEDFTLDVAVRSDVRDSATPWCISSALRYSPLISFCLSLDKSLIGLGYGKAATLFFCAGIFLR